MTTPAAAKQYLNEHQSRVAGRQWAVYNPHGKNPQELPVIYGFNNGGQENWWHAQLIAEDGEPLGSHLCSHEGYMENDLGVLEGSRPDRHETFQKHYPDGYRMVFVGREAVKDHAGLQAAFKNHTQKYPPAKEPTDAL